MKELMQSAKSEKRTDRFMAGVTKVCFGPTKEVSELTAVATFECNPITAMHFTLLHILRLWLTTANTP